MNLKDRNDYIRKFFTGYCLKKLDNVKYLGTATLRKTAEKFFEDNCMGELDRKGADYSHGGQVDAGRNFKRVAEKLDISLYIVWSIYFWKHIDSIFGWLNGNGLKAEGIDSRITDAINYLLILMSLLEDEGKVTDLITNIVVEIVTDLLLLSTMTGNYAPEEIRLEIPIVGRCIEGQTTNLLGMVKYI